ncbi:DUF6404 family protein [Shewanella submarina]|uniref:DUF6404 family protein n=1 Tax=Shewanella submarina TaxID=2016376 RepID=A0ABV7GEJ4_9GAMM|nr:DUF6404 family protein [Shewanella submarina]MCL1037152.1 DUF6404 family protein [Shewanella submarina]
MELPKPFIKAEQEMQRAGVWPGILYPLMKRLGEPIRPFPYRPFILNLTQTALWVTLVFALVMYFGFWQQKGIPLALVFMVAAQVGIVAGILVGLYGVLPAKRKKLSSWQSLCQQDSPD